MRIRSTRVTPVAEDEREQAAVDLGVALERLRAVHGSYWDHEWRREHHRSGRRPEDDL
ncbi:hypothetical protein ACFXJ8_17980 [Nonomuraea sp. NPDC059194]|uniref:DUF7711 family protein n=1 Tax=Nonomuraea sp. NPDC059194 TaxID=3346764 RepID=UPI00367A0DDC